MGALQAVQPMAAAIERVLVDGDLKALTSEQRIQYYNNVCNSLGLNPLTKPFAYITLNGKMVLYALKDCTEQLRSNKTISLTIPSREVLDGVYIVTARASTPQGRQDESTGAVHIDGLKGEAKANAMMKAETKAKRRVTLSICGLGLLDESEVDSIPGARVEHENTPEPGTREAQQQIAARKIDELQQGTRPSTIIAGETQSLPEEVKNIWDRMGSSKQAIGEVLGEFQSTLFEMLGDFGKDEYTSIITKYGDPMEKTVYARRVVLQLWGRIQELKAEAQERFGK